MVLKRLESIARSLCPNQTSLSAAALSPAGGFNSFYLRPDFISHTSFLSYSTNFASNFASVVTTLRPTLRRRLQRLIVLVVYVFEDMKGAIALKDLVPAATNNVTTRFILLDKGVIATGTEGGVERTSCMALVADETAAVHFQLWGAECNAFAAGDIIRLSDGIFSYHKNKSNLVLRAGKRGKAEKVGEFTMLFVETPNMSEISWKQDPSHPKKFVQDGVIATHSRLFPPPT